MLGERANSHRGVGVDERERVGGAELMKRVVGGREGDVLPLIAVEFDDEPEECDPS